MGTTRGKPRDIKGVCGRCDGKGYVNHVYDNGVCFWCGGFKSVAAYKAHRERQEAETRKQDIEDAHFQIEHHRRMIREKGTLVEYRKKRIADEIKRLERLGVIVDEHS